MISTAQVSPEESPSEAPPLADADAPALEIRTVFRDVVIGTRVLHDPGARSHHGVGTALLLAGVVAGVLALAMFIATAFDVGAENVELQRWQAAGRDPGTFPWKPRSTAGDVAVFGGLGLALVLATVGLACRGRLRRDFTVGWGGGADAPVSPDFVPVAAHPLVAAAGSGYVVNVTPQMTGEIRVGDRLIESLPRLASPGRRHFSLPANGRARLDCGGTTFLLAATSPPPRRLPVPLLSSRQRDQQVYTLGSAGAVGLFLLLIFTVPPDPRALSFDLSGADHRFVKFMISPAESEPEEILRRVTSPQAIAPGAAGRSHSGEEGQMGGEKKTPVDRPGATGIKGPRDNPDPHLARAVAEQTARSAGILGILSRTEGSHIASIFGRESALGADAEDVLGHLTADRIAEASGRGGLGLTGTGAGGGDTGQGLLGRGSLNVIGRGSGNEGTGPGIHRGVGALGPRHMIAPDIMRGIASVRGTLDKEIVRRIIRRHINEVKYCYELGLARRRGLDGRVVVQFTIAGSGQVIASVLGSSTLGDATVESCVVQAVRRWEFPRPLGGGLVIVSYPFVLAPAGGGA